MRRSRTTRHGTLAVLDEIYNFRSKWKSKSALLITSILGEIRPVSFQNVHIAAGLAVSITNIVKDSHQAAL
jgi:hypothetical protein